MTFSGTFLRLTPFLISTAYFFVEYVKKENANPQYALFKSLPTACLCLFVLSFNTKTTYTKKILCALVFSTIGDAVLCYPGMSSAGVGLFAIAQLIYISAFGYRQINYGHAILTYGVYISACYYLHSYLMAVDMTLGYGVEIYMLLLFTMIWRAFDRHGLLNFNSFSSLCGSVGPILFGISDLVLFYHMSVKPVENANFIIMSTYYGAQAGIALTALKHKLY